MIRSQMQHVATEAVFAGQLCYRECECYRYGFSKTEFQELEYAHLNGKKGIVAKVYDFGMRGFYCVYDPGDKNSNS